MNKIFKKITMGLCMGALIMSAASCSEPGDIISSVDYARLFSPTDIEARVSNRTTVTVSWSTRDTNVESFVVELYTDAAFGSPKTETVQSSPVTFKGLDGETEYFVRIKATSGTKESKWSPTAKFKTDIENIYLQMEEGDLQPYSVTLRWAPGETVETIEVSDVKGALVTSYKVSADECKTGVVTIKDLKSETTYTFALKRAGKTRGVVTVTTEVDLDGAIKVIPTEKWYEKLLAAKAGDVFAFMPGKYKAYEVEGGAPFTSVTLPVSVSIKAAKSTDKPVICGVNIKLADGASLDMIHMVLDGHDGKAAHTDQAIVTAANGAIDHISVSGCEIFNFTKGVIYVNTETAINNLDFNNCYIHDIECNGGDGFDFRKGAAAEFSFKNNSVVNVAAKGKRDLFRMDSGCTSVVPAGNIVIQNNNFDNCSASGKRVLYIRLGDTFPITFTNNVLSNTDAIYSNQKTTIIGEMGNNNYFKAPNFYTPDETGANIIDKSEHSELDPKYDAAYLVTNEDLTHKGIGNF